MFTAYSQPTDVFQLDLNAIRRLHQWRVLVVTPYVCCVNINVIDKPRMVCGVMPSARALVVVQILRANMVRFVVAECNTD